ncbi:MAG: DNA polymerase III subunit alpha [Kiritimatiellae bacterium]|nr:DNA polymerase III subunit alpha [Kiritimatiellia bacterium]MDW8459052.1 DNA polymerase III subunit alpha [Verrucomicrobiota bacterium]
MSATVPFVHLHFHTEYSLLDGCCRIGRAIEQAKKLGMSALAITDHGVLYGIVDFYKQAKDAGIRPIIGCEVYMAHGSMKERRREEETGSQANHQLLLCETNEGYANLMRLVSLAHLEGFYYKPRIDLETLARYSKGLIGTSSCLNGQIPSRLLRGDFEGALKLAGTYAEIFGKGNYFIELQDHGLEEQRVVNRGLLEIAKKLSLPLVATNDVHYLLPEHAEAHEVMLCLQTGTTMSDPKRLRYGSDQFYMKSGAEMLRLFNEVPDAVSNTVEIAQRCTVELIRKGELHFPTYQVPAGYTQKEYLIKLGREGLRKRYGIDDVYNPKNEREEAIVRRFFHEVEIIEKTGFINYFLVVWDFIHFAHQNKIPVGPGRGSGAGSVVAYALEITGIDPLKYGLFFERFLNPDRVSPPDFDIDFCQWRRGEVIDYVKQKYGRENTAQIITFGSLGAKTVIRDLARVLELPLSEADRLAKMIPEAPDMTLDRALQENPEFRQACQNEPAAQRILKYARVLEGLPRNPGTHAAGVVIGERPLIELIPLSRDKSGEPCTQFEMKPLEMVGLLKMDFLGLKTLTIIQETLEAIERNHGVKVDLERLPDDDRAVLDLLSRGDTVAIFQVESAGMRDMLRKVGVSRFEDLIALIALFRPGPMQFVDEFGARKNGRAKIDYPHPKLEPVLKDTYGIFLYQEQVQQAANVLAGFTLAQGDLLRRAMGKKNKEEMAAMREKFIEGCARHSHLPRAKAEAIFDIIDRFAGYGFNKSHSAAYAVIAWRTAWLKAYYPVEFMAANLSVEISDNDRIGELLAECAELDIEILPPSVNESGVRFTALRPDGSGRRAIRFGLAGIKNVGIGAVEAIVKERERGGPFRGLVDFCMRVESQFVNRKTLESLVRCGAFDFTGLPRSRLYAGIETAMARAEAIQRDRKSGQISLFEELESSSAVADDSMLPPAEPWPASQNLAGEKELLGFYISGHPLASFRNEIKRYSLHTLNDLRSAPDKVATRIAGLVTQIAKRFTKKDQKPMATFRLETLEGAVPVVLFPAAYEQYAMHVREEAPVLVCGELARDGDELDIRANEIYPLQEAHRFFVQRISLHVPEARATEEVLGAVRQVLRSNPGQTPVTVCIEFPGGQKVFVQAGTAYQTNASQKVIHELEKVLGEGSVFISVNPAPYLRPRSRSGNGRSPGG